MNDTNTREDRRSALDTFAERSMPETTAVATVTSGPPAEVVYGSREVARQRDTRAVLNEIRELAAAAGSDWYYRFPVKNRKAGTTDWIEGASIELALDVARAYGNCHVDCRAQDLGGVILFHARFHDVEKGFSLTRPFQQRKGASKMGSDVGRTDDIDFQIGASKAIRNAILNSLRTFTNFALEEAKEAVVDKIGGQIERYRKTTVERIEKIVPLPRVEAVIGRPASQWLATDIARVIAMGKAIADGMARVDETFPPIGREVAHDAKTGEILDTFANFGGATKPAAEEAAVSNEAPSPPKAETAATFDKADIVRRMMDMASRNPTAPVFERMEELTLLQDMLLDMCPDEDAAFFVRNAVKIAEKAVKGQTPMADARRYLEAMAQ
jgi:hypothetical protein